MIPDKLDFGQTRHFNIYYLVHHYGKFKRFGRDNLVDVAARYVCGFPVSDELQRNLCWSNEQDISFIESLWLGMTVDALSIHSMDWEVDGSAKRFSGWVLDGQNRLHAIERYIEDQFPVFGIMYSELTKAQRMRFGNTSLPQFEVALWDMDSIRDYYNRKALGGTPHHSIF